MTARNRDHRTEERLVHAAGLLRLAAAELRSVNRPTDASLADQCELEANRCLADSTRVEAPLPRVPAETNRFGLQTKVVTLTRGQQQIDLHRASCACELCETVRQARGEVSR